MAASSLKVNLAYRFSTLFMFIIWNNGMNVINAKTCFHQTHKIAPRIAAPKWTVQNGAKTALVITKKKNCCSSMWKPVSLFGCEHEKHENSVCCLLYFWIIVLPNDDVFTELCAFVSKYFSRKYDELLCNISSTHYFQKWKNWKTIRLLLLHHINIVPLAFVMKVVHN